MKIICPKCEKIQEIKKDELMGWYVVCRKCRFVFSWKNNLPGNTCAKPNVAKAEGVRGETGSLVLSANRMLVG